MSNMNLIFLFSWIHMLITYAVLSEVKLKQFTWSLAEKKELPKISRFPEQIIFSYKGEVKVACNVHTLRFKCSLYFCSSCRAELNLQLPRFTFYHFLELLI